MPFDYPARVSRLEAALADESIDVAVLGVGPDLLYFIGYEGVPSERLTALVVGPGIEPVLFVPELEAALVGEGGLEVRPWSDTEDPLGMVSSLASSPGRVAVGDHMWSVFLIGLLEEWSAAEWVPSSLVTGRLRIEKERAEIELLREAARGVDRVMEKIPAEVTFAGRSEHDVARDLADLTVSEGHDSAEFTIVASGPNGASPHHHPGTRTITEGDLVVCDFGGRHHGYYSDSTRTFSVGDPAKDQVEIHELVREANRAGRAAVAPGIPCQEVDRAARGVIEEAGLGEHFIHRTGHGIGLEVHERPYIVEGNEMPLGVGMTFSIEPGIYLPGRFGVRIEDIVVCGEEGADTLNDSTRDLVTVA